MSEKVLFEMRVSSDEHGTHIEINASPEWRAFHRPKRAWWTGCCDDDDEREEKRPAADDLRRALDSLQSIYNDLYGKPAEAG